MLIRCQITTLLQIFCELLLYSQVIFRSMRVADDTFRRNFECKRFQNTLANAEGHGSELILLHLLSTLKFLFVIAFFLVYLPVLYYVIQGNIIFNAFNAQGRKDFWKPSKPCHVGILWTALTEYSQLSTHMQGFQSFFVFLHHFILAKLATSSIRVKLDVRIAKEVSKTPTQ